MVNRVEDEKGRPGVKLSFRVFLLLSWFFCIACASWAAPGPQELVERMETAYEQVQDYQTQLVIVGFGNDASFQERHILLYTFKKPNKVRIDFIRPHRGMTIVYPDKSGRVVVRPKKWLPLFTFHISPYDSLLEVSPGQHINQTDLGMLIRNISHSLTDMLLGDLEITEDDKHVTIRVLSDNPFQRGNATRYEFLVDLNLWLPVGVKESSSSRVLRRTVTYENLRFNRRVADSFFELDQGPGHGSRD